VIDTANFGVVFRADTISETIDQSGIIKWINPEKEKVPIK